MLIRLRSLLQLLLATTSGRVAAFSVQSSFTTGGSAVIGGHPKPYSSLGRWTMYENPSDPPNNNNANDNAWSVLSNTEKWISNTLKGSSSSTGTGSTSNNAGSAATNPYARKEVSYVCENQKSAPLIVSSIFRLLKEARERGEAHGEAEEQRAEELGEPSEWKEGVL